MRKCYSMAKEDIQEIQHLANIIIDFTDEVATDKLLKQIKGIGNRIKRITEVWND
jgi:hypothetical protein